MLKIKNSILGIPKIVNFSGMAAVVTASVFLIGSFAHAQTTQTSTNQGNGEASATAKTPGNTAQADAKSGSVNKQDRQYFEKLAQANKAEVEAGELAQKKSTDDQVKEFAQHMVQDHSQALDEVTSLAAQKNVTLPQEPDAAHQKLMKHLNALPVAEFNKEYKMKAGLDDHKKALSLVKEIQGRAKDTELKALAKKLQPTIEEHLKKAQSLKLK